MKKAVARIAVAAMAYAGTKHGGIASTIGASVPVPGGSLVADQQQFGPLAADTGLNPGVVAAWELAEESGSAAAKPPGPGNNDWLNIGYTDSGTYGAGDGIWASPASAADATAAWMKGADAIPGYGTASSGVRAIAATAGQSPSAQIAAIQNSGWASSGYPDLASLYQQVA